MNAPAHQRSVELRSGVLTLTVETGAPRFDDLLGLAARDNAKRGFLFVSRVLGKHVPARPSAMLRVQAELADGIPDTDGPTVFIAMAETAIGLGQGVFEAWLRAHPGREALFLHTTRHRIGGAPLVEFQEAHSHAPDQFLHVPLDPARRALLLRARTLVLVDDEATTGNTFVNLAAACRSLNPGLAHVHLAVLASFMGKEACARLSERFALPVSWHALVSGSYRFTPDGREAAQVPRAPAPTASAAPSPTSARFGRLGLLGALAAPERLADALAAETDLGQRVLVLGTGEFMHPPTLLAAALERRGIDVVVQSTTRSPILVGAAIKHAIALQDVTGERHWNHLYNVIPGAYDRVYVCHETPPNDALRALAALLDARLFHFHDEDRIDDVPTSAVC